MPASGSCCATANRYRWLQKFWRRFLRSSRIGSGWSRKTNCSSRSGVTRLWKREGSPGTSRYCGRSWERSPTIITTSSPCPPADTGSWRTCEKDGRTTNGRARTCRRLRRATDPGGVFRRAAGWFWAVWLHSAWGLSPTCYVPSEPLSQGKPRLPRLQGRRISARCPWSTLPRMTPYCARGISVSGLPTPIPKLRSRCSNAPSHSIPVSRVRTPTWPRLTSRD